VRRIGHVFEKATAFPALDDAAYRAFRANRDNPHALRLMFNLAPELLE